MTLRFWQDPGPQPRPDDLIEWAQAHLSLLDRLKLLVSLEQLSRTSDLLFAVDYFEIFEYATPYGHNPQAFLNAVIMGGEAKNELARAQAGGYSVFYGLPESMYPLMVLPPHYEELLNSLFTIAVRIAKLPEYSLLRTSLRDKLPALEEYVQTLESSDDGHASMGFCQ